MRPYTTDYSGRQVDIACMRAVTRPEGVQPLNWTLTDNASYAVTGIQKLAQRYTVILLTQLDDVKFTTQHGTTFWRDMLRGASQNKGQVTLAFNFASVDAVAQMQAEDGDETFGDIPDDERIKTATLLDFEVDTVRATLYLKVALRSRAGESYVYVLPTTVSKG